MVLAFAAGRPPTVTLPDAIACAASVRLWTIPLRTISRSSRRRTSRLTGSLSTSPWRSPTGSALRGSRAAGRWARRAGGTGGSGRWRRGATGSRGAGRLGLQPIETGSQGLDVLLRCYPDRFNLPDHVLPNLSDQRAAGFLPPLRQGRRRRGKLLGEVFEAGNQPGGSLKTL